MGKNLYINKMAYPILLFLLCVFPAKSAPVFTLGGYFDADNGGEPISVSFPGRKVLNVESANFKTKHIKSSNVPRYNVTCVDNIREYFSSNDYFPNNNTVNLYLYNELGEVIASVNQQANQLGTENSDPIGAEITVSFSHQMNLKMNNIYRPFKFVPEVVYECAAYPLVGKLTDIKEITYSILRIANLHTVAAPSISVDRTSLDLGVCQAGTGTSETLSGNLLITLGYEGDHYNLIGSLMAAVISDSDTHDLTIRTASGHNLIESALIISETATGDYPLTVSVPCPDIAGHYQWNVALTYTIE